MKSLIILASLVRFCKNFVEVNRKVSEFKMVFMDDPLTSNLFFVRTQNQFFFLSQNA